MCIYATVAAKLNLGTKKKGHLTLILQKVISIKETLNAEIFKLYSMDIKKLMKPKPVWLNG